MFLSKEEELKFYLEQSEIHRRYMRELQDLTKRYYEAQKQARSRQIDTPQPSVSTTICHRFDMELQALPAIPLKRRLEPLPPPTEASRFMPTPRKEKDSVARVVFEKEDSQRRLATKCAQKKISKVLLKRLKKC